VAAKGSFSVTISAVDDASARIDAINRRIAAMRAPVDRVSKSLAKFGDTTGITALGRGMRGVAEQSLQAFENVTRLAGPLGAITGAASIAGMVRLTSEWAKFGSQLGFSAQRAGMSAGQLATLQGAARLAGSSAESLSSGLTTMNDKLALAARGFAPDATVAINALHLSTRNANGSLKTGAQVLPEFADKIAALHNPTEQAFYATALLGGAGEDLLKVLRGGSAALAENARQANRYGAMTDDQAAAARRLARSETAVAEAVEGLGNKISTKLEPYLTPMLNHMATWIADNPRAAASIVGVGTAAVGLVGTLGALRLAWVALGAARIAALGGGAAAAVGTAAGAAAGAGAASGAAEVATGFLGTLGSLGGRLIGAGGLNLAYQAANDPHIRARMDALRDHTFGPRAAHDAAQPPRPPPSNAPRPQGLAGSPFGNLISRGEGGYSSVNLGAAGGYGSGTENLSQKTVAQVMADQALGKYNAAGRYQIIAPTLRAAAAHTRDQDHRRRRPEDPSHRVPARHENDRQHDRECLPRCASGRDRYVDGGMTMGTKGTARALLRRLRRKVRGATDPATTEPLYDVVPGGVMGCRFCNALRELFQFKWETDLGRFDRLTTEGGCSPTVPGSRHALIERGDEYSSFRTVNPPIDPGPRGMPVIWFRNVDVVEAGDAANEPRPSREVMRRRAKLTAALEGLMRTHRE
jgi:hypothetical protein